jgi:hypothetical protein
MLRKIGVKYKSFFVIPSIFFEFRAKILDYPKQGSGFCVATIPLFADDDFPGR